MRLTNSQLKWALLPVLTVMAVALRGGSVSSGVFPVMLGCLAVLRGVLTVALGGCSVAAGLEALFLHVRQAALDTVYRLDEVRPVSGCCVAVLSAHRPVSGGISPVARVLRTRGAADLRRGVTFLGPAITLLGSPVTPVRPFHQQGDLFIPRGVPAAAGPAITSVGLPVPAVSISVAFVGGPVTLSGRAVTLISGAVTLIGGPVDGTIPARG